MLPASWTDTSLRWTAWCLWGTSSPRAQTPSVRSDLSPSVQPSSRQDVLRDLPVKKSETSCHEARREEKVAHLGCALEAPRPCHSTLELKWFFAQVFSASCLPLVQPPLLETTSKSCFGALGSRGHFFRPLSCWTRNTGASWYAPRWTNFYQRILYSFSRLVPSLDASSHQDAHGGCIQRQGVS